MHAVRSRGRRPPLAVAALLFCAAAAPAQPYAYVANLGSDDVAVLDTATATVVARLPAGDDPNGAAASPDGGRIYVTNFLSDSLTVIDTAAGAVVATVAVERGPVGVAVSPDGARAYVAARAADALSVVDTAATAVVGTVPVGRGPNAIAIAPDGATAYVTNSFTRNPGEVSVVDLTSGTVRATIAVHHVPNRVAIAPDGSTVYVTNFRSWNVSVIDTATDAVTTTVRVGFKPTGVTVNPNGAYAYVTTQAPHARGLGRIDVIDVATGRVRESIAAGAAPSALAILRHGATGYVTDFAAGEVIAVDLADEIAGGAVAVGDRPFAVAVDCAGAGCSATPYTPKPTRTVTATPTPTPTPTPTLTPSRTATRTATATLRPGLRHVEIDLVPLLDERPPLLDVRLRTGGQSVTAFRHDIGFAGGVRVGEGHPGVPDCQVYESPVLRSATFAFFPDGCRADCAGLHAELVAAEPFLDLDLPAVPYFCRLAIAADVPPGTYRLRNLNVAARGPGDEVLAARGRDGLVTVLPPTSPSPALSPPPSRTPLPPATATATPPPEVFLRVGSASGRAGATVTVQVRLDARGRAVAGTQNELLFPAAAAIAALANGRPDCAVNPAIDKAATGFAFAPSGCAGSACRSVRTLVLSIDNTDPIADGAVLYSCRFLLRADAVAGTYPLRSRDVGASTPDGHAIPSGVVDGTITVTAAGALARPARPSGVRRCAAGAHDGVPCAIDGDCPAGACVETQGICAAGADEALLCDCPGGTCGGGACERAGDCRCRGGVNDDALCDPSFTCRSGAPCVETHRLCGSGPSKGMPCLDDRQCIEAPCVASRRYCVGGDFAAVGCIDAGDCPRGSCVDPNAPPVTATPTPTPRPGPEDDGCALSADAHGRAVPLLAPVVLLLLARRRRRIGS